MNRNWTAAAASALLALAGQAAIAQAADDEAAIEKRLADAQERLEQAAREIAELSANSRGPHLRKFNIAVPGPGRAMLGINLGGTAADGGGVRVDGVSPGGPAAEAGVRAGDVIVGVDGKSVATSRDLLGAVKELEPGQNVAVDLKRDGKPVKVKIVAREIDRVVIAHPGVALAGMPGIAAVPAVPPLPALGAHWLLDEWGDAELVTLTPKLGRYFGAEKGVLVARAPEDESLGLQDGDVIVAIGGREPQDGRHAMRILRSYQPGETVELRILRDRRAQTLSGKVPARATGRDVRYRFAPRAPDAPRAPKPPAPPEESAAS